MWIPSCACMCVCVWPSCRKATALRRGMYLLQFLTAGPYSCPFPHMKEQQSQHVYMHAYVCVCVCVWVSETWKTKAATGITSKYSVPHKSVLRWYMNNLSVLKMSVWESVIHACLFPSCCYWIHSRIKVYFVWYGDFSEHLFIKLYLRQRQWYS